MTSRPAAPKRSQPRVMNSVSAPVASRPPKYYSTFTKPNVGPPGRPAGTPGAMAGADDQRCHRLCACAWVITPSSAAASTSLRSRTMRSETFVCMAVPFGEGCGHHSVLAPAYNRPHDRPHPLRTPPPPAPPASPPALPKASNFLRQVMESDLAKGTHASRRWAGSPGDAAHHAQGGPDPAKIRT